MHGPSWASLVVGFCLVVVPASGDPDMEEDASPELKAKYSPLFEQFQLSYEAAQWDQALKKALAIQKPLEKDLGPVHAGVLQINVGVALCYAQLKKVKEGEAVFSDLLARLQRNKLTDSPKMLFVLESQRDFYTALGSPTKAKAADAQADRLLAAHPDWAKSTPGNSEEQKRKEALQAYQPRFDLVYQRLGGGDVTGALALASELADSAVREFGATSPVAALGWRILATVEEAAGQDDRAESDLLRSRGVLTSPGTVVTMDLVLVLEGLRSLYQRQGRQTEADNQAHALQAAVAQDPALARDWAQEQAKQKEKEASQPPKNPPSGPGQQGNPFDVELAKIEQVYQQGRHEDAVRMLTPLLGKMTQVLEPDDPVLALGTAALARYQDDGSATVPQAARVAAATGGFDGYLATVVRTYGDRSRAVALALLAAAQVYAANPAPPQNPKPLFQRALALFDLDPGTGTAYAEALEGLAAIYQNEGAQTKAAPLLQRAKEFRSTVVH